MESRWATGKVGRPHPGQRTPGAASKGTVAGQVPGPGWKASRHHWTFSGNSEKLLRIPKWSSGEALEGAALGQQRCHPPNLEQKKWHRAPRQGTVTPELGSRNPEDRDEVPQDTGPSERETGLRPQGELGDPDIGEGSGHHQSHHTR